MNWRMLSALGAAGVVLACDSLPIPFLNRNQAADTAGTAAPPPAAVQPADTAPAPAADSLAPATPEPAAAQDTRPTVREPETRAAAREVVARPLVDEPWTTSDTGTVAPAMSRDQVIALWGPPVVERTAGAWTYLYYRNGCEVTCGTFDVIFLENGQVVDAILRWAGHRYSGTSSSPPGQEALPTLPATGGGNT